MTKTNQNWFHDWFWSESFWLHNKLKWKDLQSTPKKAYGQAKDLVWALPLALALFGLRLLFERYIAKRIGLKLNIPDAPHKKPYDSIVLEKVYTSFTKNPDQERIDGLCKQLDWNERQVYRWFRRRRRIDQPTNLKKFCESAWRFIFYLTSTISGIIVVYGENFLWDSRRFYSHHPRDHELKPSYYRYYMLELSFYFALFFSQFTDIRRKDFFEMFLHHVATILLISGSYITNFTKIGASIMLLHDCSDVFLEFAKMAKYAKFKRLTTISFVFLSVVFIATRLWILPLEIILSVAYEGMTILKPFSGFLYVLFTALILLQVLHLYWFSHLVTVAYATLFLGKGEHDSRSDSESSSEENGGVAMPQ